MCIVSVTMNPVFCKNVHETKKLGKEGRRVPIQNSEMLLELPTPSRRLKIFLSQRRDTTLPALDTNVLGTNLLAQITISPNSPHTRRSSWVPQESPTSSKELPLLQRSNNHASPRDPKPSQQLLCNRLLHSSDPSSLCGCDHARSSVPACHSLSFAGSRPPPPPKHEVLCSPMLGLRNRHHVQLRSLPKTPKVVRAVAAKDLAFEKRAKSAVPANDGSKFVVGFEVLEISPVEARTTKEETYDRRKRYERMALSESVERLIRETDEAFRSVGSALVEARASTEGWRDVGFSDKNRSRTQEGRGKEKGKPAVRGLTGGSSTEDSASTSNGKAKKEKKRMPHIIQRGKRTKQLPHQSHGPRLTFKDVTNNVVGVFSGKAFRMEVDEMPNLKPPQPPRIVVEGKKSFDSIASTEAGKTPTDPFHLEGLTSRIAAAQRNQNHRPPLPSVRPPLSSREQGPQLQRRSRTNVRGHALASPSSQVSVDRPGMTFQGLEFKTPPKKKLRHRPSLSKEKILKPIHEVQTPLPSPARFHTGGKPHLPPLSTSQPGRFITFQSTPFTLTSPLFRHGPVKIQRQEREYSLLSPPEEGLDWTAFQMAILGTMDEDGGDQRDDWGWEAHELEVDGIVEWWKSFGFEGYGNLECPHPEANKVQDEDTMFLKAETYDPSQKIYTQSKPKVEWGHMASSPNYGGRSTSAAVSPEECSTGNRLSVVESLPPSPMLDFTNLYQTGEEVRIPMGYNLGHDLGDFLRWESNNVQILIDR